MKPLVSPSHLDTFGARSFCVGPIWATLYAFAGWHLLGLVQLDVTPDGMKVEKAELRKVMWVLRENLPSGGGTERGVAWTDLIFTKTC